MQAIARDIFNNQASFNNVKAIRSLASVKLIADSVENPAFGSYEYQISSLGTTMLIKAFHKDQWVFCPESHFGSINTKKKKKPDMVVQLARFTENDNEGNIVYATSEKSHRKRRHILRIACCI